MAKTLCFYHSSDLDGHCSAAIFKLYNKDIELIPIDYGDKFPWDIVAGQNVIMVDFTLQPYSDMLRLQSLCRLIWIDHHKTSIEWAEANNFNPDGFRLIGKAGCELAWEYLYEKEAPRSIQYLSKYDTWNYADNPNVLPFQYAVRALSTLPDDTLFWHRLFYEDRIDDLIDIGYIVLAYQKRVNEGFNKYAFDLEWEGLKWVVLNGPFKGSNWHTKYDINKYDAMMGFFWDGTQYIFSLTTEKDIDLSIIAGKYGGGGHKRAAGFQTITLPFTLG
jgi:hypothetical protein